MLRASLFSPKCPLPTLNRWRRQECAELWEKPSRPGSQQGLGCGWNPARTFLPGGGGWDSVVRAADGPQETLTPWQSLSLSFIESFKYSSVHVLSQKTFTSPWWQALCWALRTLTDLNLVWGWGAGSGRSLEEETSKVKLKGREDGAR